LLIPFSHTLAPSCFTQASVKRNPYLRAVASSIPLHFVQAGATFIRSRPSLHLQLHSISHLRRKSKRAPTFHEPFDIKYILTIIPCSCTLVPYDFSQTSGKWKPYLRAVASSIPLHFVQAGATFIRSRSFTPFAASFHQPPPQEKQECCAPLQMRITSNITIKSNSSIFFKRALPLKPKKKKESKGKWLAIGLQG